MFVHSFPSGPFSTNAYLVFCEKTKEGFVIDPSPGSFKPICQKIEALNIKPLAVLLTHSHWDHIADASFFVKERTLPLFVHEEDRENLLLPGSDGLPLLVEIEGVEPTGFLKEGSLFPFGLFELHVIDTPGHSRGSVCFYEPSEKVLFSGDTLFCRTIGNLSFPTSAPDKMGASLKKLSLLPEETLVYPGHGETTTIGDEKRSLDYFAAKYNRS